MTVCVPDYAQALWSGRQRPSHVFAPNNGGTEALTNNLVKPADTMSKRAIRPRRWATAGKAQVHTPWPLSVTPLKVHYVPRGANSDSHHGAQRSARAHGGARGGPEVAKPKTNRRRRIKKGRALISFGARVDRCGERKWVCRGDL